MDQERPRLEQDEQRLLNRRQFLGRVGLVMGGIGALILGGPFIGFLTGRRTPVEEVWIPIGPVESIPVGSTQTVSLGDPTALPWAGFAAGEAAFLRRESDDEFLAFSVYCTHVGCPVRWEAGAQLFMCPCHGGTFYRNGAPAAGPPTTPLAQHPVRVRDGQVEVRRTVFPVLEQEEGSA